MLSLKFRLFLAHLAVVCFATLVFGCLIEPGPWWLGDLKLVDGKWEAIPKIQTTDWAEAEQFCPPTN